MTLKTRHDAARALADRLRPLVASVPRGDVLVLGVPHGGVVVAAEVARLLDVALDVLIVRRVTLPGDAAHTLGIVGEDVVFVDDDAVAAAMWSRADVAGLVAAERDHVARAARLWRHGAAPRDIAGRVAIVVDDGLTSAATALAALRVVTARRPRRVIVAAPVAERAVVARVRDEAEDVVCLEEPEFMLGLGSCYESLEAIEDDVVTALLDAARARERERQ